MSIESDFYTAVQGLVAGRVYPLTFAQPTGLPTWPAIRYTFIDHSRDVTICGDGGAATADARMQVDVVAATYEDMRTLRLSVLTALEMFTPPALCEGEGEQFDEATKTHRARLDFVFYPSST